MRHTQQLILCKLLRVHTCVPLYGIQIEQDMDQCDQTTELENTYNNNMETLLFV